MTKKMDVFREVFECCTLNLKIFYKLEMLKSLLLQVIKRATFLKSFFIQISNAKTKVVRCYLKSTFTFQISIAKNFTLKIDFMLFMILFQINLLTYTFKFFKD